MDDILIDNFFETRLVGKLNKLRINKTFTDFAICIDGELIKVHKIVLAANSDYFKAMLTSESSEEIKNGRVTLEDIDPEIVKLIVNYWYTGKMKVTSENICPLMLATSRLQANDALEMCTKFAEASLTAANCLSIASICERCNLVKLFQEAFALCLEHFEDIIKDTEILAIDEQLLMKIISDDRLNVSNEIHVFVLIIRWIEFDKEPRSSSLDKLMSQVRYASIRPASLFEPSFTKFINCSARYRELCERAKTILMLKDNPSLQKHHVGSFLNSPRKSENRRLYVFGGIDYSANMIEVYDPSADQWLELGKAPIPIGENLAVAISRNCVYAMNFAGPSGGILRALKYADPSHGASLYYNLDTNHWSPGAGLTDKNISNQYLVALDRCIYSFGASTDHIDTVNRYDLSKKTLKMCAKMQLPRFFPGIVVNDHHIYLMGGCELNSSRTLRSVERYDPRQDKWEFVASMKNSRMLFGGCSYKGKIYVAGGEDGDAMNQAEVYDPELDTWTEIAPMNCSRVEFGLAELAGQIYAVGGSDKKCKPTNSVEAYDPDSDMWVMKNGMCNKRAKHCLVVL